MYILRVSIHKTIKPEGGVFEGFDIVYEITCLQFFSRIRFHQEHT